MRLINYTHKGANRCGAFLGEWLVNLEKSARYLSANSGDPAIGALSGLGETDGFLRMDEANRLLAQRLLNELSKTLNVAEAELRSQSILIPLDQVDFLPSVSRPGKIVCVGLNYPELGPPKPSVLLSFPILFLKPASALTGHGQPIILPRSSSQVLYEGELAVVIGKVGKYIPPHQAWSHVAGFTIANDVGAKDLERRTSQWTTGKISDTFCPLGPALVTPDEVPDPQNLRIQTTVNGEIVQEGNTAQMIFDIPTLISYISELATLEPGDLILTGSPKGIGVLLTRGGPLQSGDTVTVEIEHIGILTNPVIAEER